MGTFQSPVLRAVMVTVLAFSMFPEVALAQDGIWTTRAPLPTARLGASAATVNGKIYVVGGAGTSGTCGSRVGTLEVYDPATGSWSTRAPMPTPRDSTAAVAVGERLYVIGGDNICLGMLSTVEVYDPITDTWTTKAPMPTPRSGLAAAVVDGIVYAIGGVNFTSGWLATVEAYNPVSNNWSVRALMPTARGGLGVEVVDGVIYAVGGVNATTQLTSVEAYDPKTDSWSAKTPMPTPRCCSAVGLVRGILYVAGGVAVSGAGPGDNSVRTVESYNPALNAWSSAPPMPTDRSSPASAVAQDTLFVMGGVSFPVPGFTILAVNEAFSPFLMVSIDIKPGDSTNTINLKSNGVVPVAILGSKTFDPMTVDPSTVTFAGAHVATRGRGAPMTGQADVNGDGYPDLILYFRTQDLTDLKSAVGTPPLQQTGDHRSPLQVEAVLYGTTYSGQRIRGSGMVRIVPAVQTSAPTFPRGRGTVTNNLASTVLPRGQGRPAGTH